MSILEPLKKYQFNFFRTQTKWEKLYMASTDGQGQETATNTGAIHD